MRPPAPITPRIERFHEEAKRCAHKLGLLLMTESRDEWRVHDPQSGRHLGTVMPRTNQYTRAGRTHAADWAAALKAIAADAAKA